MSYNRFVYMAKNYAILELKILLSFQRHRNFPQCFGKRFEREPLTFKLQTINQIIFHCATASLIIFSVTTNMTLSIRFFSSEQLDYPVVSILVTGLQFFRLFSTNSLDFLALTFQAWRILTKLYRRQANCSGIDSRILYSLISTPRYI